MGCHAFSRGSSWPRDWTCVSCSSCNAGRFFTTEPLGKPMLIQAKWWWDWTELLSPNPTSCTFIRWEVLEHRHLEKRMPCEDWGKESQRKSAMWRQRLPGCIYWVQRRQWHPTPVFLPGESHGWRSLVGCSPWGHQELNTTEGLHFHFSLSCIGEGNGNPLQCSCLENPRDGGAWWAAVYGVAQSRTRLKQLSSSIYWVGQKVCLGF